MGYFCVGQYTLPDPLRMENGEPVKDAQTWREKRRPEILHLFETHVYGRSTGQLADLSFEKTSEDKNALGGIATRREVSIYLTKDHSGPRLDLLLYVPNAASQPVPAFLGLNFEGNQIVSADPGITVKKHIKNATSSVELPRGTWSDDGALILCTTESLLNSGFDLDDMGRRFVHWMNDSLWTATGKVFDVGIASRSALTGITNGTAAGKAGGRDEGSNGNGSLMRILPVALRLAHEPPAELVERVELVSAITHAHARSRMTCVFYNLVARQLLLNRNPRAALEAARAEFAGCYEKSPELALFHRHLENHLVSVPESEIASTGYVLDTMHASL